MKKYLIITIIFLSLFLRAQTIPVYYNNVNLNLTGIPLKTELSQYITNTHSNILTYSEVWNVLKVSDLNPTDNQNVWLIYGWNDTNGDITDDLNRDKNDNGGSVGDWNREHTFAKSLGTPNLGTSGPGADAHNLRASDVQRNGTRGNKKFTNSSGTASAVSGSYWFPGTEWRGDVARIIMYMYLRYNNQCKPSSVTVGNPVGIDLNMVDLLLNWNSADPVNDFEENRNEIIFQNQGNRNPFIDNPYLATLIWGGIPAENKWNLSVDKFVSPGSISIFPNPTFNSTVRIETKNSTLIENIDLCSITGQNVIFEIAYISQTKIIISDLIQGLYILSVKTNEGILNKKIIIQ